MIKGDDTRRRLLHTAAGLFQRQGYHGTGLNQILDASQAPKGSLYHHFPGGKEQVAVEAVTRSAAALSARIGDALGDGTDPLTGLTRIADLLGGRLLASGYLDGCPVAAVAQDAASGSDPIRSACGQAYAGWLDVLDTALRRLGVPAEECGPLGIVVLSAIEGALLLSRVQHDVGPLHAVTAHLAATITAASTT
jgi:TetR/AcrR family transcriptional repressor of lmrAB and yxaGH operons